MANPNPGNHNPNCNHTKLQVPNYDGSQNGKAFLRKFELIATKYRWDHGERCLQLAVHCSGKAETWLNGLPQATLDDWALLSASFRAHFLDNEPRIVTESKLQARKLNVGSETVDDYHSSLIELGAQLGRNNDEMASAFINGLPQGPFRTFVLAGDTHSLQNYLNRARLYAAQNSSKSVNFQSTFNIDEAEITNSRSSFKDDIINAVTAGFDKLKIDKSEVQTDRYPRSRSNSAGRPHRPRSNDRQHNSRQARSSSRSPYRGPSRSPYRGPSRGSFRGNDQRFSAPSRGGFRGRRSGVSNSRNVSGRCGNGCCNGTDSNGCFNCGCRNHWARDCRNKTRQNKGPVCYTCGVAGHVQRNCRNYLN